ncbi:glycoside hydrolase family 3 protein [Streptomyces sp. NPDC005438]|uniref:glycoside hydrolase family 3 protein n=1 Tax=Streptomyces sp. NPDC005438 TaxID=3156880 RepID=UPI0033A96D2B
MSHPTTRRQAIATGLLGTTAVALASTGLGSSASAQGVRTRATALLKRMSLEQKVGQLFVLEVNGHHATKVDDEAAARNQELFGVSTPAEVVAKYQPGGVIYFDARRGSDNLRSPDQIATLSNGLQRAALRKGAKIPLLISIDQEGGAVVYRLEEPATMLPGSMALAASRSTEYAERSARVIGTELAAMGINQNYAPVADVNINPANPVIGVRSFGSDPELCSRLVSASVRGYHHADVTSAAKHFPGHGDTDTDSHTGLPEITHSREELERIDLPPFRAAIKRGVDTIMTAHIVVPALDDSKVPATMSKPIVTGLLREELGFEGLIVTDALDMAGASDQFPDDVAPVRALQAGCDQLVLPPDMDVAFKAVLDAVKSGEISEKRVDASVRRVLEHKLRGGLFPRPYVDPDRAERVVGNKKHRKVAQAITDRTVTLVRNESAGQRTAALPLDSSARKLLVAGWDSAAEELAELVGARDGQTVKTAKTGAEPDQKAIDAAVATAQDQDVVLVVTNAAAGSDKGAAQAKLVKALLATGKPVVALAVRNPYDIQLFPEVTAYLASYTYGTPSLISLDRALYGEVNPGGKLPVAVSTADDPDQELYPFGHGLRY